jgi:5-formyltetrahydrofolate cyclo-ligase
MSGAALPDTALRLEKKALRAAILARRDALDAGERERNSRRITEKLLSLREFRDSTIVAAYASFGSEFDTSGFLAAVLAQRKRLILPRVDRETHSLELREVRDLAADLAAGVMGIREPLPRCPRMPASAVEFFLVPGVAATIRGDRMGYGGGFYDGLLAGVGTGIPKVLALFSVQLVDRLPVGPRDQRVTRVLTEEREVRIDQA